MIRSRGTIGTTYAQHSGIVRRTSDNSVIGSSTWTGAKASGETRVIEWDSSKRRGPSYGTRRCHHVVHRVNTAWATCSGYMNSSRSEYFTETNSGTSWLSLGPPSIPGNLPHLEAMSFFASGCVSKELSLVNTLMELDDIPRMITGLPQLLKGFNTKKVDKSAAGTFLGYEFGVLPLISDIKGVYSAILGLQNKLEWLRRKSGKPVRVSFHKTLEKSSSSTTVKQGVNADWKKQIGRNVSYHAFAVMQYDVSEILDIELALRIFKRQLGLTDILSIAWEAIPFTWVVDQFLRIGNWLESLPDFVTLPYRIIDSGWAVTIEEELVTRRIYHWPISNGSPVICKENWRVYHREPGIPITFESVGTGLPSLKQLALDFAAGIQKL